MNEGIDLSAFVDDHAYLVLQVKGHDELVEAIEARNDLGIYPRIFLHSDAADEFVRTSYKYAITPSFDINDYEVDYDQTINQFIEATEWCREQFGRDAFRGVVGADDPRQYFGFEEVDLTAAWAFDASEFIMYFHNERDAMLYKTLKGF